MLRPILIVLVAIAVAYAAWFNAAAAIYSKFAPPIGLQLDPSSALALVNLAESAAKNNPARFRKIAQGHARRAIASEPLSARALRQMGTYYSTTGDELRGGQLVRLSAMLTKRDPVGQMWLAEDALRRRDGEAALRAFDIVIRTAPEAQELSFRLLGAALADTEFRSIFAQYAKTQPDWLKPFIEYNVSTMTQPQLLSRTLVKLSPLPRATLNDAAAGALLTSLVNRAPVEDVRDFYRTLPGSNAKFLISLSFAPASEAFRLPPIGWETISGSNVQGFGNVDGKNISIEAIVMPGRSGTAARKLLFLPPGNYAWRGNADLSQMVAMGSATLSLLCNKGPGEWSSVGSSELKTGINKIAFTVPAGCDAQLLTIDLVGGDSQVDSNMVISDMALAPITKVQSQFVQQKKRARSALR